jgi:hypothetical protein
MPKSLAACTGKYYKGSCRLLLSILLMRSILACLLIPVLLSGCAAQGTIVEKRSRQRPDSSMIGTEGVDSFVFRGPVGTSRQPTMVSGPQFWTETGGSYKFILRDQAGNVRSQLVTPAIFVQYNVGDYFNDTLPPVEAPSAKDHTTKVALHPDQAVQTHRQMAQTHRNRHRVAKHHRHLQSYKAIARRASSKTRQG